MRRSMWSAFSSRMKTPAGADVGSSRPDVGAPGMPAPAPYAADAMCTVMAGRWNHLKRRPTSPLKKPTSPPSFHLAWTPRQLARCSTFREIGAHLSVAHVRDAAHLAFHLATRVPIKLTRATSQGGIEHVDAV